jgi:hypothetical protein
VDSAVGESVSIEVLSPAIGKPTAIAAGAGEVLGGYASSVGDLDADGIDDFVIYGEPASEPPQLIPPKMWDQYGRVYLFYGRERFPDKLSSADADAILAGGIVQSGPVGDVNGDGYADLLVVGRSWVQFIFGRSRRLQGMIDVATVGVRWLGPKSDDSSLFGQKSLHVVPAGDVDGDGLDDLLAGVPQVLPGPGGSSDPFRRFLILGRKGGWPAGQFDENWAQAVFDGSRAEPDGRNAISETATPLGDIDGDGYADLSAIASYRTDRIFYGGPNGLRGFLGTAQADAILDHGGNGLGTIGDVDGDGCDDLATWEFNEDDGTFAPRTWVIYGLSTRWSGATTPARGLAIALPVDPPPDSGGGIAGIRAADIDQDGKQDIVLADPTASQLYLIRGNGERRTGSYRLQESELLMKGVHFARGTEMVSDYLGTTIDVNGDLDGNGGPDVLAGAPGQLDDDWDFSGGTVYVIPGSGLRPQ